jgi:dihydroflavonol-4-reductase
LLAIRVILNLIFMEGIMSRVLVTGASGFIGMHCIQQLIKKGYEVNSTMRSIERADEVRDGLVESGVSIEKLNFFKADLLNDDGWDEAIEGCEFMLHVASPFVIDDQPEEFFTKPAVEGALRAMRFAQKHCLKKVVLTSSFAAIGDTFDGTESFDESHWSDASNPEIAFYNKSKTLAEKAAWDFVKDNNASFKLTVINPVAVTGPSLSKDIGISNSLVLKLINGKLPGIAKLHIGYVDVRDVAFAHIAAMENANSDGHRIVVSEKELWMNEAAKILREAGYKTPKVVMPKWVLKIVARFDKDMTAVVKMVNKKRCTHSTKAKDILNWDPIPAEQSIVETADQIKKYGLI